MMGFDDHLTQEPYFPLCMFDCQNVVSQKRQLSVVPWARLYGLSKTLQVDFSLTQTISTNHYHATVFHSKPI